MKESTTQIQCVDYLTAIAARHNDLVFFSIPNEGLMSVLMAFKIPSPIAARIVNHFKKMGLLPGVPDFEILFRGKCFFVEFKAEGEYPNEKQYTVHNRLYDAGFIAHVCRSFDEFLEVCNRYGIR